MTRRSVIGLAAVMLCAAFLVWRIRTVAREPRVPLAPRVVQLMYNRMLAVRIQAYARRYGRPAYYLDSVQSHLDSAEAKLVSELRTDLWGDSIYYFWSYCSFTLGSRAGTRPWLRPAPPPETVPPVKLAPWSPEPPQGQIFEDYLWPAGVGRTENCFGDS